MVHDRVVQRAVRLDVSDGRARHATEAVEGADLVDDIVGQLPRRHVDEPATEPGQVAVGDLGPDDDSVLDRTRARPAQGGGVTGVEAAGHVGRRDEREHGVVVAQHPPPERLAQVGVEVHGNTLPRPMAAKPLSRNVLA